MDGIIAKLNYSPFNLWIPRKDPWGTRDPGVKTTVLESMDEQHILSFDLEDLRTKLT